MDIRIASQRRETFLFPLTLFRCLGSKIIVKDDKKRDAHWSALDRRAAGLTDRTGRVESKESSLCSHRGRRRGGKERKNYAKLDLFVLLAAASARTPRSRTAGCPR